ncbi:VPA1262 family N-terminal domain-containing protein [Idiomarina sp.]|uniref:VPA1262 family N-terminal domain-containing protein n=1 Tax=Idiomarina sp. TaxID=1874361 RepID=UPI003A8F3914
MLKNDFYSAAVIRLVTLQKRRGQAGQLLFATISLLPRGRPIPYPMSGIDRCSVGKTGETVFFRRTLMNVQEAIDWYRGLGSGDEKSPIPSKQEERSDKYDGIKIEVSELSDDPAWPHLGLPIEKGLLTHFSERSHPAPFIGNHSARIHRRFGNPNGFDSLLADDKAVAFISRRIHLNVRLYREYLGSAALVAPDPVLQQIDCFMIPASGERGERIFYRFVPRAGESVEGLKVTTFDEQGHLLTDFKTHNITESGILDIDKGYCIGSYGYVVSHQEHGILAYSPPSRFMRQMNFSMHASTREVRKISVPINESDNAPRIEYSAAPSKTPISQSIIGKTPNIPNNSGRVTAAEAYRDSLARAEYYGQRWFSDGSREEAMRFIQSELRQAKSRVIIADPYLAGLQLGQFLYAVNPETTGVTLLTSNLAFKSRKEELSKIDNFDEKLAELEKFGKITANVHVLLSPILHDRFMVIDDSVWFLGNSLNTLGDKASLIVKLPNPNEVIEKLKGMLKQAASFKDYKSAQLKTKRRNDD